MQAIDLFCGCGGISVGLEKAGFNVIAGVDIDKKYITSFEHNFPSAKSLCMDLSSVSPDEFMSIVGLKSGQLDLLAGGPPCQGFSKNVPIKRREVDSQNNQLIKTFLDYCYALSPKMIMMENVAEMRNGFGQKFTRAIVEGLEDQGYIVTEAVLTASDYGVPQKRRRAFFMANRVGVKFSVPHATHFAATKRTASQSNIQVSVWDAIGDLPSLKNGEIFEKRIYSMPPQNSYQEMMRAKSDVIKNHEAKKLQPKQYARIASLEPGQGHKDLPDELKVKGGYSGAYGRLTKGMIAPTITRWVFHAGSGRWGHPVDLRLLTMREVARIQSFPDNFELIGSYNDQAGQLGNAVPPILAEVIAKSMLDQMHYSSNLSSTSKSSSNVRRLVSSRTLKEVV